MKEIFVLSADQPGCGIWRIYSPFSFLDFFFLLNPTTAPSSCSILDKCGEMGWECENERTGDRVTCDDYAGEQPEQPLDPRPSPFTQSIMMSETIVRPSASDSSFFSKSKTTKDTGRSSATTTPDSAGAATPIVVTRVVTVRRPAEKSPATPPPSTPLTPQSRDSTPVKRKKRKAGDNQGVTRPAAKKPRATPPTKDWVAGSSRSQTPVQATKTRESSRVKGTATPEPATSATASRSRSVTAAPNDALDARECWITDDGIPRSDLKSCEQVVKGILKGYKTRTL